MNRARLIRTVLVPLLIAMLATAGLYQLTARQKTPTTGPVVETVRVAVATRAIPSRTRILADMVVLREVPASYVLPGSIRSLDACVGRVTLMPIAAGEMLLASKVTAQQSASAGLSFTIPEGKRALTIQVDEIIGVAAFPQVGDSVDVFWTYMPNTGAPTTANTQPERRTRLLMEKVSVLAVVQDARPSDTGAPRDLRGFTSVTLELTPEQAAIVVSAESSGLLRLALRPALDDGTVGEFDISTTGLFQATRIINTNLDRRIGFETRVLEVDAKALVDLGYSTFGASLVQLNAQQVAAINGLVAAGKAKVLDRSVTSTNNRTAVSYSLGGEARPEGAPATSPGTPYGLAVSLTPLYFGQPQLSVDAKVSMTTVTVSSGGLPAANTISVGAALRSLAGEGLMVTGLVSPGDLSPGSAISERFALPRQLVSAELTSGERVLVVLTIPSF